MSDRLTLRVRMALGFAGAVLAVTALTFSAMYFTARARLNALMRDDLSSPWACPP